MNRTATLLLVAALPAGLLTARPGPEDESVFVRGLRPDQHESVLYVWTSDADQKDADFLTVIDASPTSSTYGTIITTVPTSAPANEAHHFGYTVNADRIFAGGLFSNRLFIYDVATDPRHPTLVKTVPDLAASTGFSGPHTFYAVPGGVMIAMLGAKDGGAPGALVQLDNDGNFVKALPAPDYMYDVGIKPELNRCSTAVRHRRPVAPHAREHGALPSGADDEAHARQQAPVREQLAALELGRQGALSGTPHRGEREGHDARSEVRCGFRAPADGRSAAA